MRPSDVGGTAGRRDACRSSASWCDREPSLPATSGSPRPSPLGKRGPRRKNRTRTQPSWVRRAVEGFFRPLAEVPGAHCNIRKWALLASVILDAATPLRFGDSRCQATVFIATVPSIEIRRGDYSHLQRLRGMAGVVMPTPTSGSPSPPRSVAPHARRRRSRPACS